MHGVHGLNRLEGHLHRLTTQSEGVGGGNQHALRTQQLGGVRLLVGLCVEDVGRAFIDDVLGLFACPCVAEQERHALVASVRKVVGQVNGDVLRLTLGNGEDVGEAVAPKRVCLVGSNRLLRHVKNARFRDSSEPSKPLPPKFVIGLIPVWWHWGIKRDGLQTLLLRQTPPSDMFYVRRKNQLFQIGHSADFNFQHVFVYKPITIIMRCSRRRDIAVSVAKV